MPVTLPSSATVAFRQGLGITGREARLLVRDGDEEGVVHPEGAGDALAHEVEPALHRGVVHRRVPPGAEEGREADHLQAGCLPQPIG